MISRRLLVFTSILLILFTSLFNQQSISPVTAAPSTPPRFLTLPFPQNSGAYFYDGWYYTNTIAPAPNTPLNADHKGIDYLRSDNASFPILAAAGGDARWRWSSTYGNVIEIKHVIGQETWYTIYAHLQDVLIEKDGAFHGVERGAHIANAGKTGVWPEGSIYAGQPYSTIHLHFELSKNAPPRAAGYERVDPYGVYGGGNYYPGSSAAFTTNPPSYASSAPPSSCSAPGNGLPRDNQAQNNYTIRFTWTPPACNGLDYYTFRVATHSNLSGNWIISRQVDKVASSTEETFSSQYNGQTLYWSIVPHNGGGDGPVGGPWAFKIDTTVAPPPPSFPKDNWAVEYFRNKELTDRCDTEVYNAAFLFRDWGDSSPRPNCPSDNWSARFTRRIYFQGGSYSFSLDADDWARIYVDNNLYVNHWNGSTGHIEGYYVSPGEHDVRVEFADTMGAGKLFAWWSGPGYEVPMEARDPNQWYAEYWLNPNNEWNVFAQRNEGTGRLDHDDWGYGGPGWNMESENFSVRFRRDVFFECGIYSFTLDHDDGARLWIDNQSVIDEWNSTGSQPYTWSLTRGTHEIKVDYHEDSGYAHVSLDWSMQSGCAPGAPSLSSPSNNSNLPWDQSVTLSWNNSSGATQYYTSLQGGPGVQLDSNWISGTSWQIGSLPPGYYTWTVKARNDYGTSTNNSTAGFTVQQPPIDAYFDATPLNGSAPLAVTFHNLSTGNYTNCTWTYSDGQTSNSCDEYHTHTYNASGSYTVTLSLSGPGGSDSYQRTSYIQVNTSTQCYTLTTQVNPSGSGTIHRSPAPNCNGNQYTAGTWVEVSVEANAGYQFKEWSGALVGGASPTYLVMNGNQTLTANFEQLYVATPDWRVEYFSNASLSGQPSLVENVFWLYLDWGYDAPHSSLNADNFSARFTRTVYFPAGSYQFYLRHDDGGRIYVDGQLLVDAWDRCCTTDSGTKSLTSGNHEIRVEVSETGGAAYVELWWKKLDISGWKAEYFNNGTLFGRPTIVRDDPAIDFEWTDNSPDPMIREDGFSVRWSRQLSFPGGRTMFYMLHDDGVRLYIDGNRVFEDWCANCRETDTVEVDLAPGSHSIMLEMYENSGWAGAKLWWDPDWNRIMLPLVIR